LCRVVVCDLTFGGYGRHEEIVAPVPRTQMQQHRRRESVIVIQPIERRCLERAQGCRERVRQTVGCTEDRVPVWIRGLGSLPEEREFSLRSDHLIDLYRRDFAHSRICIRIQVVARQGTRRRPARCWKQRLNLYGDGVPPLPWNDVVWKRIAIRT